MRGRGISEFTKGRIYLIRLNVGWSYQQIAAVTNVSLSALLSIANATCLMRFLNPSAVKTAADHGKQTPALIG